MSSTTTVTVVLALLAATAYGVASALQSHEASKTRAGALRGLVTVLAQPLWWGGVLADVAGLALHVGALSVGPATIVQPVQVTGLLVALPLGRRLRHAPRSLIEAVPAIGIVAGIAVFLVATRPTAATSRLGGPAAVGLTCASLVTIGAVLLWSRRRPGTPAAVGLATVAGAGFAVSAVLMDDLSSSAAASGWGVMGSAPGGLLLAAVVLVGAAATVCSQAAFQQGTLAVTLPVLTLVDPVVAVALGALLLGETSHLTATRIGCDVVAALTVVGCVAWITRLDAPAQSPRWQRSRLGLATAAGVGCLYGLALAPFAVLTQHWLDADDPAATRILVLAACCVAVALANTVRTARAPVARR